MPVEMSGVVGLKKVLKNFAPDIYAQLEIEVGYGLTRVRDAARAKVPSANVGNLYNFTDDGKRHKSRTSRKRAFPRFNSAKVVKGLTYSLGNSKKNSQGYVAVYRLLNKNAVGAIIETAGRKNYPTAPDSQSNNKTNNKFVPQMSYVGQLKKITGKQGRDAYGRLLYAAWNEDNGRTLARVVKAVEKAATNFKRRAIEQDKNLTYYGKKAA